MVHLQYVRPPMREESRPTHCQSNYNLQDHYIIYWVDLCASRLYARISLSKHDSLKCIFQFLLSSHQQFTESEMNNIDIPEML